MTQNDIDSGGLQSCMTQNDNDSGGLQSTMTQNDIDSGGLQSSMTQNNNDSGGLKSSITQNDIDSSGLQSSMAQIDIDSGDSNAILDDDLVSYDCAIIRIPRRTLSAPPELESLPTIPYAPPETTLLTLPVELQQKILRNLLSGYPTLTSPIKHTLHPEILRVNKHLSSVGKQILYNENDWILVENATPFLRNQLKLLLVPIASSHHLTRFNEHRLSIRFEGELFTPPYDGCFDQSGCLIRPRTHLASRACNLFPRGYRDKHSPGRGNVLLHGGNMQLLVRAISTLSHCFTSGNRVLIVETKRGKRPLNGEFIMLDKSAPPPTTMVHVQRNSYDKWYQRESFKIEQWNKKVKALLEALKGASGVRQTSISGDVDHDFAQEVKSAMNSKVVFREAMGWNLIDLLRDYKKDLDDMVCKSSDRDCLCQGTVGYAFMLEICRHGAHVYLSDSFSKTNIDKLSWEASFLLLASDVSTTLSRTYLRKGNGARGIFDSGAESYWFKLLDARGALKHMEPSFEIDARHDSAAVYGAAGLCEMARDNLAAIVQQATTKGVDESHLTDVRFDLAIVQSHLDSVDHTHLHSDQRHRSYHGGYLRCPQPCITPKAFSQSAGNFRDHIANTELTIPRSEGLEGWLDTKETLTERDLARLGILASEVPAVMLE
ncbi:hypothetical protein BDV97DRAFT_370265 [Delphinella strobiligena]|nr:hypothetical protein BDV97DRAFT_370265 [Delphinella strobiligena]